MILQTKVKSDECMCCGSKKNLTEHHAIPRRMKPNYNSTVTICTTCHELIHSQDIEGLKNMIYKGYGMIKYTYNKVMKTLQIGERE